MKNILLIISLIGVFTSLLTIWKKQYMITGIILSISLGLYTYFSYNGEQTKGEIIVAISPDYAPYAYIENGEIKGIDVDLLKHLERQLGKKIVFKQVEFGFLTATIIKGEADIAAGGLSSTEEREGVLWKQKMHFTTTYCYPCTGILIQGKLPANTFNKKFNGKILVQSGSLFVSIIQERFPNATILSREDFNIALEEFKEGKADAIVGDALALVWFYQQHIKNEFQIFKLKHKLNPRTAKGNAFIVSENNKKLDLDAINKMIIQYKKDKKFFQEVEELGSI